MTHLPEHRESLWWLSLPPLIWLLHFLLAYATVAIACAKGGELRAARWAIAAYTVVAVAGALATGWHGLKRHRLGWASVPHDFDTPEDRHRFIGFAQLLLSGLCLLGVLFVALPALFFETCR